MKPNHIIMLLTLPTLALIPGVAAPQSQTVEATAAAIPSYILGPADVIRVWVFGEQDLSTSVTVRPDGRISLPLAGTVDAGGRSPEEVEAELETRLATYLSDPIVVVVVEEINSKWISVLGEVAGSGRFPVLQRLTVLDAIALAGGFTQYASREVHVVRDTAGGIRVIRFDVGRFLQEGTQGHLILEPGDTVWVR